MSCNCIQSPIFAVHNNQVESVFETVVDLPSPADISDFQLLSLLSMCYILWEIDICSDNIILALKVAFDKYNLAVKTGSGLRADSFKRLQLPLRDMMKYFVFHFRKIEVIAKTIPLRGPSFE